MKETLLSYAAEDARQTLALWRMLFPVPPRQITHYVKCTVHRIRQQLEAQSAEFMLSPVVADVYDLVHVIGSERRLIRVRIGNGFLRVGNTQIDVPAQHAAPGRLAKEIRVAVEVVVPGP